MLAQSEEFKKSASSLLDEFTSKGPFASNIKPVDALAEIERYRQQMEALRETEATLRRGLNIFKIDQPPSKDIAKLESEMEQLQIIWEMTRDWDDLWETWKSGKFVNLVTKDMEETSNDMYRKLHRMGRELKDRNWEILEVSRNRIDQFRRTMPLVNDLRQDAMRPRHWDQIQAETGRTFEATSDEFTLEKIIEWLDSWPVRRGEPHRPTQTASNVTAFPSTRFRTN